MSLFCSYCDYYQKDPFGCNVPFLCIFLDWLLVEHKLQPITIRDYLAVLARVWTLCHLPDITKSTDVKLILTNFEIERPREGNKLFPLWDINVFLDYLLEDSMCDIDIMLSTFRIFSTGTVVETKHPLIEGC